MSERVDVQQLASRIRTAIIASMAFTGAHPGYTHDDYDDAHAALGALLARLDALEEVAEAAAPFQAVGNGHPDYNANVDALTAALARLREGKA